MRAKSRQADGTKHAQVLLEAIGYQGEEDGTVEGMDLQDKRERKRLLYGRHVGEPVLPVREPGQSGWRV